MPDSQTINQTLSAYGLSGMMGGSGGFNWWNLIAGFIFSIVGWYAFKYGKREKNYRQIVLGLALMIYPYFVSNTILSLVIGLGLCAGLYFWRG